MRERTPTNNTAMIVVAWMVIAASLSGWSCIGVAQAEDATADVHVRIGAHNVLFGNWAKPQRIGEMFKAHDLDVIGFNEVPNGDWTAKVGKQLGMKHAYVGKIASANHKDKYKSILSRTPLTNMHEIEINAKGWKPASMVGADTMINGVSVRVYSLHIPGRPYFTDKAAGSAAQFIATEVIPKIDVDRFIIIGDFNSHVGDAPFNKLEQAGMRASWKDIGFDVLPESTHQHIETGTESGVIDHIFYNVASGAKACGGGIIKDAFNPSNEDKPMPNYRAEWEKYGKPLSDHRPIWAELVYPDTAKSQVSVDPAVIDNRDKKTVAQTDHPLDWFHEAKSGIMIHYLANPLEASGAGKGIVLKDGQWDRQIDAFDVDGLADQLQDIGADYLVISVGQNTGYYCSPNATYDKIVGITPSKCSRRDLVVDLSKALKARGIRLIVYLPSNAPANDPIAVKKLKWRWRSGERLAEFQRHWEAVIHEWSLRWGTHVAGWWIDGCYFADEMYRFDEAPNFASFAAALRAGNPDAIITFNKPGQADSPHEDYTAGELWVKGREVSVCPGRWVECEGKRLQYHALTFLGSGWGVGDASRYSTDDLIKYTRRVTDGGGVMTWDVPCQKNGLLEPGFVEPLKTLHSALANDTKKTAARPTARQTSLSAVATLTPEPPEPIKAFRGAPTFDLQQIFSGERFPNVVVATDGTILTTWGRTSLRVRRSEDGGEIWGTPITVGPGFQGGGTTVDETSGDILVFVEEKHPPAPLTVYRSKDSGKTWNVQETVIHPDSRGNVPSMSMNEHGITLRHGKHKGRLLRPARWYDKGNRPVSLFPKHYTTAIYSDDGGKTWQTSEPFPEFGTGEATMAELADGTVYYNTRRHWAPEGKNPRRRWHAWSRDGGQSWQDVSICEVLPDGAQNRDYGLMGGLVRLPVDGRDILLYSNIVSQKERANGHVWASFDGGKTWPIKRLVFKGAFAYSSLTVGRTGTTTEGLVYLFFEGGPKGGGTMARFNLAWLLKGKSTGDGELPEWIENSQ